MIMGLGKRHATFWRASLVYKNYLHLDREALLPQAEVCEAVLGPLCHIKPVKRFDVFVPWDNPAAYVNVDVKPFRLLTGGFFCLGNDSPDLGSSGLCAGGGGGGQ